MGQVTVERARLLSSLAKRTDKEGRDQFLNELPYMKDYEGIDFRKNPELYKVNRGEQGVLMAEPYRSEIGPHWRFKTPEIAEKSSTKIKQMFLNYIDEGDFVGADMCRKYLMMGWTRARRYANHASGKKYDENRNILPFELDSQTSEKAESARIFKEVYDWARQYNPYLTLKLDHKKKYK